VAKKPLPQPFEALKQPMDRLKKWVDYIPEVRMGKAVYRWVKSQPPVEPQPTAQPESRPPQSR
jgi:hypothetical protein